VALHCHSSKAGAQAVAARIGVGGNRAAVFEADLTHASAAEALLAAVEARLGPPVILVNSAALFERHPFLETPLESLDRQWALNTRAPYLLTQAAARRGALTDVINVLDVGGVFSTWRNYSAYGMTKAALAALTKALALELAPKVRVNAVAPGTVLPPDGLSEQALEALRRRIPQQRFGGVAPVVEAVNFLVAGPSYVTGQILAVDGGRSLETGAREANDAAGLEAPPRAL
jgi:pteridine reductase